MCAFREADVPVFTPEMRAFNTAMSEVRISVEWLFGDILSLLITKKTLSLVWVR